MYNLKGFKNNRTVGKIDDVYIRNKVTSITDENGNEIEQYSDAIKYNFNVMPVTDQTEIQMFGETVSKVRTTVLYEICKYKNLFKEYDLVYLEEANPNEETYVGEFANYEITSIKIQNSIMKLFFTKIIK